LSILEELELDPAALPGLLDGGRAGRPSSLPTPTVKALAQLVEDFGHPHPSTESRQDAVDFRDYVREEAAVGAWDSETAAYLLAWSDREVACWGDRLGEALAAHDLDADALREEIAADRPGPRSERPADGDHLRESIPGLDEIVAEAAAEEAQAHFSYEERRSHAR